MRDSQDVVYQSALTETKKKLTDLEGDYQF